MCDMPADRREKANELFVLCDDDGHGRDIRFLAEMAMRTIGSTNRDRARTDLLRLATIAGRIAALASELAADIDPAT